MRKERNTVLTDTRREYLLGDYEGTRQAKNDHKAAIRDNTRGALADFQFLFEHTDQADLERTFQESHSREAGPVAASNDYDPIGFGSLNDPMEYIDDEGRPRDPEHNPDSETRFNRRAKSDLRSNKASPTTQGQLIESVAFLCRAAEAGELDPDDLIKQGMEAYYSEKAERDNRAKERIVKITSGSRGEMRTRKRAERGGYDK